jgi:DNA-binding transcriptional regulator YhcF (GntR family)
MPVQPRGLGSLIVTTDGPDRLDDLSGVPRYREIAEILEREIRDGQWPPGTPVRSRRQISGRFGVAWFPGTARSYVLVRLR